MRDRMGKQNIIKSGYKTFIKKKRHGFYRYYVGPDNRIIKVVSVSGTKRIIRSSTGTNRATIVRGYDISSKKQRRGGKHGLEDFGGRNPRPDFGDNQKNDKPKSGD